MNALLPIKSFSQSLSRSHVILIGSGMTMVALKIVKALSPTSWLASQVSFPGKRTLQTISLTSEYQYFSAILGALSIISFSISLSFIMREPLSNFLKRQLSQIET